MRQVAPPCCACPGSDVLFCCSQADQPPLVQYNFILQNQEGIATDGMRVESGSEVNVNQGDEVTTFGDVGREEEEDGANEEDGGGGGVGGSNGGGAGREGGEGAGGEGGVGGGVGGGGDGGGSGGGDSGGG